MAQNLPNLGRIVLTEMDTGNCLNHLTHTVQHNHGVPGGSRIETAAFDWSHVVSLRAAQSEANSEQDSTAALLQERWDFVVGSDLIYGEEQACLLPQVSE